MRTCKSSPERATSAPSWTSHRRPTAFTALGAQGVALGGNGARLARCDLRAQLRVANRGRLVKLRIASARPILGPLGPCARVVVHVYLELSHGLPLACIPSSGLLRLAWQQLDSCIVNLGACWPHTVPRRCSRRASSTAAGVCPVVSGVKIGPSASTNCTVPSSGCVLQGLRPWLP